MLTDYLPYRLRTATGFTLVERDLLAEVHARDLEGGCPDDADQLAAALCGLKAQHVATAVTRLRQMRLLEVVLDPDDRRCLRPTALALTYWETDDTGQDQDERPGTRPAGTPNQTEARRATTLTTHATPSAIEDGAISTLLARDTQRETNTPGVPQDAPPPHPLNRAIESLPPAEGDTPPTQHLLPGHDALDVEAPAEDMNLPVSAACPPEGGVREGSPSAVTVENETRTREEWIAEKLPDLHTPHEKPAPPALAKSGVGTTGRQVVTALQGGYTLPGDLFRALPTEVILATHRGEPCIPMRHDKKPLVKWKQFQERLPTPHEFRRWLAAFGNDIAGWARVTGRISNLIVLDDDTLQWLPKWGLSPHLRTRRGAHWLGEYPGWRVATVNAKSSHTLAAAYPHLDIRADGGYSIICGFDGNYTWLREPTPDPLDLLPRHARKLFGLDTPPRARTPHTATSAGGLFGTRARDLPTDRLIAHAVENARAYGRNNSGFLLALRLRDTGHTEAQALHLGRDYISRVDRPDDPYTEAEWHATVRSAYSRSPRR